MAMFPELSRHRHSLTAAAVAVAALLASIQPASAQNLVQNPDFSANNGSFDGYTTNAQSFGFFEGTYAANLGTGNFLSQTITTIPETTYLVTFLATFGGQSPASFTASFGTGSLTYSNATGCCSFAPFSFTATATGKSEDLLFTVGEGGNEFITDLSVEAAPAPIPGTGAPSLLLGFFILSAAAIQKLRRRNGAVTA